MPTLTADRTEYYRQYYLQTRDLRRYLYYEKRAKENDNNKLYAPYGGEKAYYKQAYKEWAKLGECAK